MSFAEMPAIVVDSGALGAAVLTISAAILTGIWRGGSAVALAVRELIPVVNALNTHAIQAAERFDRLDRSNADVQEVLTGVKAALANINHCVDQCPIRGSKPLPTVN